MNTENSATATALVISIDLLQPYSKYAHILLLGNACFTWLLIQHTAALSLSTTTLDDSDESGKKKKKKRGKWQKPPCSGCYCRIGSGSDQLSTDRQTGRQPDSAGGEVAWRPPVCSAVDNESKSRFYFV